MKEKKGQAAITMARNKVKIVEAMEKTMGVVTSACKLAGVTRPTFYNYLRDDPEFAEKIAEMPDVALDFVESKLFEQIRKNIPASTIFYLKTKGKNRGYVERNEVDMNVTTPINLTIEKTYDSDSEQD